MATYVQQQKLRQKAAGTRSVSPLVASIAQGSMRGSGGIPSRYLLLPTDGPAAAGKGETAGPPEDVVPSDNDANAGAPAAAEPTLAFGLKSFRNALVLCHLQLGGSGLSSVSAAEYAQLVSSSASGTSSPSDEQTLQVHAVLRLALLHLSWICLSLGDYLPALSWASQLISLDACPPSLKVYGHIYACDALCQLNRSKDALEHLTAALELGEPLVAVTSCTGADSPPAADGEGLDCVRNPYSPIGSLAGAGASRATLYTNLAVVHILRGNTKEATQYVHQALSQQPDCRQALLCYIYLEIAAGRAESALELLKRHRSPK